MVERGRGDDGTQHGVVEPQVRIPSVPLTFEVSRTRFWVNFGRPMSAARESGVVPASVAGPATAQK